VRAAGNALILNGAGEWGFHREKKKNPRFAFCRPYQVTYRTLSTAFCRRGVVWVLCGHEPVEVCYGEEKNMGVAEGFGGGWGGA
jgi:hypothetical protein